MLGVVHKLNLLSQWIFIVEPEKKINECLLKCKAKSFFHFLKNKNTAKKKFICFIFNLKQNEAFYFQFFLIYKSTNVPVKYCQSIVLWCEECLSWNVTLLHEALFDSDAVDGLSSMSFKTSRRNLGRLESDEGYCAQFWLLSGKSFRKGDMGLSR